jgi:hypothetical protein
MTSATGVCEHAMDTALFLRSVKGTATFTITAKEPTLGINSTAMAFG